jgi:hypothetical protein
MAHSPSPLLTAICFRSAGGYAILLYYKTRDEDIRGMPKYLAGAGDLSIRHHLGGRLARAIAASSSPSSSSLSIAERAIYFAELNATPFIELHRADQTDMPLLMRGPIRSRAAIGCRRPSICRCTSGSAISPPSTSAITPTSERVGKPRPSAGRRRGGGAVVRSGYVPQFYQDPLYPYLIGVTYRIAGHDVRTC